MEAARHFIPARTAANRDAEVDHTTTVVFRDARAPYTHWNARGVEQHSLEDAEATAVLPYDEVSLRNYQMMYYAPYYMGLAPVYPCYPEWTGHLQDNGYNESSYGGGN